MRNVIVKNTAVVCGVIGAIAFAQGCTADTLEVQGLSDVPRQTGMYIPPEVPGYPPTGDRCQFSGDLRREGPLTETTSLGFSGSDVIARFNAEAHGALRWADGTSTQITLQATSTAPTVTYDEFPKDEEYCTPNMNVPLDELVIRTSDGAIDARLVSSGDQFERLELVGSIDGHGGIGLIFDSQFVLAPEQVDSPLVEEANAANPEHDQRHISVELSLSATGAKARCIKNEEISEDAAVDCNIFDGVLRYHSMNSRAAGDIHNIPAGTFYDEALASWFWTE